MFEWELVTMHSGTLTEKAVTQWTTDYVDDAALKATCSPHAEGETVALLYVSFEGYEKELFQVHGRHGALKALGYPPPDFEAV